MKVVNIDRAVPFRTTHGSEIRPLIDRTTSTVSLCSLAEETLPPGRAVTPHLHRTLEEIYYIVSGSGLMTVGDETRRVAAGDAILIPRDHLHTLENTSGEPMRILLICGPAFSREDEVF